MGLMGLGIAVLGILVGAAGAQEIVQIEVTTTIPGPTNAPVTVRSTITTRAFTTITRVCCMLFAIVVIAAEGKKV